MLESTRSFGTVKELVQKYRDKKSLCFPALLKTKGTAMSLYAPYPRIFKCPFCGELKPLVNQLSGNTNFAVLWSDMQMDAIMLTPLSRIQQCPSCGKFFALAGNELDVDPSEIGAFRRRGTHGFGYLSFEQAKAAVLQFLSESTVPGGALLDARTILVQTYNDIFRPQNLIVKPGRASSTIVESDSIVFKETAEAIVRMDNACPFLKMEMLRELGRFDECIEAGKFVPEDDEWFDAVPFVLQKAREKDSKVFALPPVGVGKPGIIFVAP